MVQSSENSLARSPQDGGSPAVGSGKDRQRGQQFRVDREVVPSIGVDPDAAPASGLSRVTAEPLTSVVDNHVDVTPKVVVQSGATFLSGEPVLVAKAAGVTVVEDAGTSHEPSAGPATALAPRSRLRDRGGDRDGWVVFVDGDGTSAPLPEPPARDVPQLLPKGRERTLEVSRVADEVREEAQRRMADADSLEDFVLWQRAAITDGQSDRVGWVWDFRRPTEDDLIEGNETAENKAEIAKKVAIMEALKEKIDALPPQDGMVRVAIKRIDTGDDDFLPPTYQVLGTFPEGIFVKDELQRFLRGKEIDNAKQAAREEGKAATAFFEPTQPCSMITCSALQEVFGEEAFYILYDERAETGEGVDTVTAAIHGNSAAESEYKLYLLTGLAGGFGNEFFRVRISDYRKWETEYASTQGSGTSGKPAPADARAIVAGDLDSGKQAQLAGAGQGDGPGKGLPTENAGEDGDHDAIVDAIVTRMGLKDDSDAIAWTQSNIDSTREAVQGGRHKTLYYPACGSNLLRTLAAYDVDHMLAVDTVEERFSGLEGQLVAMGIQPTITVSDDERIREFTFTLEGRERKITAVVDDARRVKPADFGMEEVDILHIYAPTGAHVVLPGEEETLEAVESTLTPTNYAVVPEGGFFSFGEASLGKYYNVPQSLYEIIGVEEKGITKRHPWTIMASLKAKPEQLQTMDRKGYIYQKVRTVDQEILDIFKDATYTNTMMRTAFALFERGDWSGLAITEENEMSVQAGIADTYAGVKAGVDEIAQRFVDAGVDQALVDRYKADMINGFRTKALELQGQLKELISVYPETADRYFAKEINDDEIMDILGVSIAPDELGYDKPTDTKYPLASLLLFGNRTVPAREAWKMVKKYAEVDLEAIFSDEHERPEATGQDA